LKRHGDVDDAAAVQSKSQMEPHPCGRDIVTSIHSYWAHAGEGRFFLDLLRWGISFCGASLDQELLHESPRQAGQCSNSQPRSQLGLEIRVVMKEEADGAVVS
jgi:hypothetical protein